MWLAPFGLAGVVNRIDIDLEQEIEVSMLRLWNYNKSRIHSYRGAKHIQVYLAGARVFTGIIQQAPGHTRNIHALYEAILFTN